MSSHKVRTWCQCRFSLAGLKDKGEAQDDLLQARQVERRLVQARSKVLHPKLQKFQSLKTVQQPQRILLERSLSEPVKLVWDVETESLESALEWREEGEDGARRLLTETDAQLCEVGAVRGDVGDDGEGGCRVVPVNEK